MHEQQGVATVANERRVVALAPGGVEFLESLLGKSAAEGLGEADILRITQDLMELAGTTCQETSVVLQCTLHGIAPEVISEQLKMPRAKVTRRLAELRRSIKTIEQITPTMTRGYIQANAATPAPAVAEPAPDAPHDVAAPIDVLEEEVAPTSPVPRQLGDVALLSVQLELGEEEDEQYEDEVIAAEPDDLFELDDTDEVITLDAAEAQKAAARRWNSTLGPSKRREWLVEEAVMRNRLRGAIRREVHQRGGNPKMALGDERIDQLIGAVWGEDAQRYLDYLAHAVVSPSEVQLRDMIVTTPGRIAAHVTGEASATKCATTIAQPAIERVVDDDNDALRSAPAYLSMLTPEQLRGHVESFLRSVPVNEQQAWQHVIRQWCDGEDPRDYALRRNLTGSVAERLNKFSEATASRILASRSA